jgi:hypothetical protein
MPENPFAPFDKVREAIKRVIEPFGVEFMTWQILPGDGENDERSCSILLSVKADAFLTDDARRDRDLVAQMEAEERALEASEALEETTDRIRAELTQNLGVKGGGIFDDSPEE